MILLIDNYDSFVYNLYQYLRMLGQDVQVIRNDKITVEDVRSMKPRVIVISPGPCTPREAGVSVDLIRAFFDLIPILGVCLGHQSIAYAFGATIHRAPVVMHAKTSLIEHDGKVLFEGLESPLSVMRYHSLVIDKETLTKDFLVTAYSLDDNSIMAIRHKKYLLEGIQFHPESIMTPEGMKMLENFLRHVEKYYS